MRINPVDDFAFLEEAIELYKQFWTRAWRGHEDKQACSFDGSIDDLHMLNYCEYELGHPGPGYESAAIIWANVIVTNTVLSWGKDSVGNLVLFDGNDDYVKYSVDIIYFVTDLIESSLSQFDSFVMVTEKLAIDMIMQNYELTELNGLKNLIQTLRNEGGDSYSERLIDAIGELWSIDESKIERLLPKR